MSNMRMLQRREIGLSTLEALKSAWASPSACVKSNWCRIPAAVIIFIGLLFLFTFFCCCAQCLSCCCCRPRRTKRGFADQELGNGPHGQRLLPNSASFGQTDLPAMPSFGLTELKKPQYAVIGDDGSVTTDDPEKRLKEDFPSPTKEYSSPSYAVEDNPPPRMALNNDPFGNANGAFHDNLLSQHGDTSYNPSAASQYSGAAFSASARRNSPPRRALPDNDTASAYSGPPPSFSTLPRLNGQKPRFGMAQTGEPQNYNSSRGAFNAGGPFPIIKPTGVGAPSVGRPLPNPTTSSTSAAPSRNRMPHRLASNPTVPDMSGAFDDDDDDGLSTPYPVNSYEGQNTRDNVLNRPHGFDPYASRHDNYGSNARF